MSRDADRRISQRELRDDSGAIMRAVERGETFTITRNGTPVARVVPVRRRTFVPKAEAVAAFASAHSVDADRLRSDLDASTDASLPDRDW